ncbi:MAG: class I SAM-dependent methyltransferase [Acidimicrobiia bacterium]
MPGSVPHDTQLDGPLGDDIARQYRRWVYPEPISDLDMWLDDHWEWFDPSHAQPMLWPDRAARDDLEILVAGCGANQAAVIAHTNPRAQVTGIDVSDASLDHQRRLARKHSLGNLELHRLPVERVDELGRRFDLVICTGVLHHLAEPQRGMDALGRCLRSDGVLGVMLYARYGRVGVEMLQDCFRNLGLEQTEDSLAVVTATIRALPADHPLRGYLSIAGDLDHAAGLVDTFLNARDRSYTVADCLSLVESAGLVFDDWFLKAPYHPRGGLGPELSDALDRVPITQRWSIMERINWRNGCHFFTACRPERPPASYLIDFESADAAQFTPALRHRCVVSADGIARGEWTISLDERQMVLVRRMDGSRTIDEIAHEFTDLDDALALFHSLWRLDCISVGLPGLANQSV